MKLSIRNILVVDDTPSNLHMMDIMLGRHGLIIDKALDASEALEKIDSNKPDLIMLDIRMPGKDGFEFCEVLRENPDYDDVDIIFVTAVDRTDVSPKRMEALNIRDIIRKPILNDELEQKLYDLYGV
ncbi:MAG: response regulator [Aggregatilineales bacterium]